MARAVTAALPLPLAGERARIEEAEDGALLIFRAADNTRVGRVVLEELPGALFVHELVIAAEYRGYGLGSDAARLIREAAAAAGYRVLRASAPPDRGLAVYFWSRMGFRPLFGEAPSGGISFERVLPGPSLLSGEGGSTS